jgi:hypothetical protein
MYGCGFFWGQWWLPSGTVDAVEGLRMWAWLLPGPAWLLAQTVAVSNM